MNRLAIALCLATVTSCNCGKDQIKTLPPADPAPTCETDPSLCPPPTKPICEVNCNPVKGGTVTGRVCAADGSVWLAGATIWVRTSSTDRVSTVSDMDGRYTLKDVPPGEQVVHIEKGSFTATQVVTVQSEKTSVIPDAVCQLNVSPRVAVVKGSQYDRVEAVLNELGVKTESLDIYNTDWAEKLLSTDTALDKYDILFLNCRSYEPVFMAHPDMQQRLRNFVTRGGKLHASDQAYDIIEKLYPTMIEFYGDDTKLTSANQGDIVNALSAKVVDPALAQGLGKSTISIHYGLTTWSAMVSVDSSVHTYLTATSPLMNGQSIKDAPHIVGFQSGKGHVVYSSFHQEPGIGLDQEKILKLLMFEL